MIEASSKTTSETTSARARRIDRVAWLMDESIRLPGGRRIGLDGLVGLVPGVGDLSGAAVGCYLIYEARALGVPKRLLARMCSRLALETIVGTVPLLGDAFDFYYKANKRNMATVKRFLAAAEARDRG